MTNYEMMVSKNELQPMRGPASMVKGSTSKRPVSGISRGEPSQPGYQKSMSSISKQHSKPNMRPPSGKQNSALNGGASSGYNVNYRKVFKPNHDSQ